MYNVTNAAFNAIAVMVAIVGLLVMVKAVVEDDHKREQEAYDRGYNYGRGEMVKLDTMEER